ncbi:hypothetical protein ACFL1H_04720 [Nanoarchaeota archaeon]
MVKKRKARGKKSRKVKSRKARSKPRKVKKASNPCQGDAIVAIAGTIGGISLVIFIMGIILAKDQIWILAPVIGSLALMGIFLGLFAAISKNK